jgi:hypothetical protein
MNQEINEFMRWASADILRALQFRYDGELESAKKELGLAIDWLKMAIEGIDKKPVECDNHGQLSNSN